MHTHTHTRQCSDSHVNCHRSDVNFRLHSAFTCSHGIKSVIKYAGNGMHHAEVHLGRFVYLHTHMDWCLLTPDTHVSF